MLVVELKGDELRVAVLQPVTLGRALESGAVKLPFVRGTDQLILNGTTAQLRAARAPYLARKNVLSEPTLLRREAAPADGVATVSPSAGGCGARSPAR